MAPGSELPGRDLVGIIKFMEVLERVLRTWPDGEKQTFFALAEQTKFNIPHVIEFLSEGLERSLDVHDPISKKDTEQALSSLQHRLQHELEADRQRRQSRQDQSVRAYNRIMTKVCELTRERQWYQAYRTLSYFGGSHVEFLDRDSLITLCNDCVRIGGKAEVNLQELGQWLRRGAENCLAAGPLDGLEEAMEFVDAHSDHFTKDERGMGPRIIETILQDLQTPIVAKENPPQLSRSAVSYPMHNAILD